MFSHPRLIFTRSLGPVLNYQSEN
uniref:Uncharacterized protein n=1 Tax=Anguilla anguilla TaxID=7936 RepID=A0A0E9RJ05_ANGAN